MVFKVEVDAVGLREVRGDGQDEIEPTRGEDVGQPGDTELGRVLLEAALDSEALELERTVNSLRSEVTVVHALPAQDGVDGAGKVRTWSSERRRLI